MSESMNRAFLYGESVFTTMKMTENHLCDWDLHFERLKKGVEFVYGPFKSDPEWAMSLKNRLEERLSGVSGSQIVRLTVYQEGERGLMKSLSGSADHLQIHLGLTPSLRDQFEGKTLNLRTAAAPVRPLWWPDYLKSGNYLESILSLKMNLKEGDDDLLFLSSRDTVLESSVANIFVLRHNKLFTAPCGPQVLDGVMRRKVIDVAKDFFEVVSESETTLEQLFKADAVFGTNSVRGPFLIGAIDEHVYSYSKDFLSQFDLMRKRVLK